MGTGEHKQCCHNQKNGSVPADALIRLHCIAWLVRQNWMYVLPLDDKELTLIIMTSIFMSQVGVKT